MMQPASSREIPATYFEALLSVLGTISTHRDPRKLFPALAETLRKVIDLDSLGVVLYDEKTHTVHLHALETFGQPFALPSRQWAPEETSMWHAYQTQQPLVMQHLERETRFPEMIEGLKKLGVRSHCTVPLTAVDRRLGGLGVSSRHPAAYSDEAVHFLCVVASQVALAIGDSLNLAAAESAQRDLQTRSERLKLILDLNNSVAANLELRDLLRAISASIRQVMQCDLAGVALPAHDGKHLRLSAFDFPDGDGRLQEEDLIPIEESSFGYAFKNGAPYLTGHTTDPLAEASSSQECVKCKCIVPLVSRNRVLGVLGLVSFEKNRFTLEDLDFLTQIGAQVAIAVENALAYGEIAQLKEQLAQEKLYLADEIRSEFNFTEIVGTSAAIRRVLHEVETVAASESTVLILGETGTGKELIARAIHDLGSRKEKAFVKLNCAAIPTGLLESELFGHEKGAFTGAISRHIGRFELAHRGTVFLDEIGDIPLELQPKLLRVLQEREFERLGSTHTFRTDARLIAATNRDLEAMVGEQQFRADLFYRLNVFPIYVPPLRERREDIPLLVRHFAQQFARRMNKKIESIPRETMKALVEYRWPGNIRELQNVIERAVILSQSPALKVPLTALKMRNDLPASQRIVESPNPRQIRTLLEDTERKQIIDALEEAQWVVAGPKGAAARLGLKRSTLQFRMRKLGIARHS